MTTPEIAEPERGSIAVALLRVTLGVILFATWIDNLDSGLYGAEGFEGFIDGLFSADGNDSSLGFYKSFVDAVIIPISGVYVVFQAIIELLIAVALIAGIGTRAASLMAMVFFANLFLAYFGGHEWIWTYVLLFMASLTVFLGYGGRALGLDNRLIRARGRSPLDLIW